MPQQTAIRCIFSESCPPFAVSDLRKRARSTTRLLLLLPVVKTKEVATLSRLNELLSHAPYAHYSATRLFATGIIPVPRSAVCPIYNLLYTQVSDVD
jgi:hypothetical protein